MVKVKSESVRRANYSSAADRVSVPYKQGVEAASGVIEASIRGQSLYVQKMTDAAVLARRVEGLRKVSDADWKNAAATKGAARIGAGMKAAVEKQIAGFRPIASALEGLTLPDRVADANANIDARLKPVVEAMQRAAGKL